jgi:hypothetical protein
MIASKIVELKRRKKKNMTLHQHYMNIKQIINFTYVYNQMYTF